MRRTNSLLAIYGLPIVLMVAAFLYFAGIHIPWYVMGIAFPLVAFALIFLLGSIALAREKAPSSRVMTEQRIPSLVEYERDLYHTDRRTRETAADALAQAGDDRSIDLLCQALQSLKVEVRASAALGLSEVARPRATDQLCQRLSDPDPEVRFRVAMALMRSADARALEPLVRALQDPDPSVSRMATRALANLGSIAFTPLSQALKQVDFEVRWYAAEALIRMGDLAKELISQLKQNPNSRESLTVELAIEESRFANPVSPANAI